MFERNLVEQCPEDSLYFWMCLIYKLLFCLLQECSLAGRLPGGIRKPGWCVAPLGAWGELVAQALFGMCFSLCLCPLFRTFKDNSCIPHPSSRYGMLLAHQPVPFSDVSS